MSYCGNCKYCKLIDGEWTCINEDSDNYSLEVEKTDSCIDWEKRGQ